MGAEQSSTRDSHGGLQGGEAAIKCHYDVLGIARDASQDDIKKAYRKKALELHPDRNYGNAEQATQQFAEVQSAYEILSDLQERAWYDSHRDVILRGGDTQSEDHFEHNIRLTSSDDIVALISRFSKKTPFTDAPNGFYGVLRSTFANLAKEEEAAFEWQGLQAVDFPGFGHADDNYESIVKPFYSIWLAFSTKKSYSWKAVYKFSEAPDRRIRRAMEKENKRLCDEAIREFNDAVRTLVAFARKRDPRYISNSLSEADRQRTLREASAAQAARSRAANQAKLNAQYVSDWAKPETVEEEDPFSGEELSEEERFECVTCGKIFKSEKQYEAHEKSKKHIKAIQILKRQMQKENKNLNLNHGYTDSSGNTTPIYESGHDITILSEDRIPEISYLRRNIDNVEGQAPPAVQDTAGSSEPETASDSENLSDEYASRNEVEARFSNLEISKDIDPGNIHTRRTDVEEQVSNSSVGEKRPEAVDGNQKIGKAKLKRAKKAARQEENVQGKDGFKCASCGSQFPSKSRLFNHIKEMDHAQPISKASVKAKNRLEVS